MCKLLIAEDEHLVAMGIAANVKELGHTVIGIAPDGEQALQLARQQRPDLALMDINMPKKSGIEAASDLYTELGIPSIIISAYSDQEHMSKIYALGESAGVFGYLLKPVSPEDLRVQIGIACQRAMVDCMKTERIDQLQCNLLNRRVVEQAKWILVEKRKITEPQAHELMQRTARDKRKQLIDVAQGIVTAGDLI